MINYDHVTKEDRKYHYSDWPQIPDHQYRILKTVGSRSGKINALLNLIKKQDNDNYPSKHLLFLRRLEDVLEDERLLR